MRNNKTPEQKVRAYARRLGVKLVDLWDDDPRFPLLNREWVELGRLIELARRVCVVSVHQNIQDQRAEDGTWQDLKTDITTDGYYVRVNFYTCPHRLTRNTYDRQEVRLSPGDSAEEIVRKFKENWDDSLEDAVAAGHMEEGWAARQRFVPLPATTESSPEL